MSGELTSSPTEWLSTYRYGTLGDAVGSADVLRQILFETHLVVIRGLGGISAEQFVELAEQFGKPEEPLQGATCSPDHPMVEIMRRRPEDQEYNGTGGQHGIRRPSSFYWHSDRSFLPSPSFLTLTRVVVKPEVGGATDFINTEMMHALLLPEERAQLEGAVAVHSYAHYHAALAGGVYSRQEIVRRQRKYPPVAHPVIQQHPVTGASVLYMSPLTLQDVMGPQGPEVKETLANALRRDGRPATYSHRWQQGDIVIWDNFGVMHRGRSSRGARELQRITVAPPDKKV